MCCQIDAALQVVVNIPQHCNRIQFNSLSVRCSITHLYSTALLNTNHACTHNSQWQLNVYVCLGNYAEGFAQQCFILSTYIYIQSGDSGHVLKVLKQLLCVDGIVYMLQEIYGLENKSKQEEHNSVSAVLVKQMLLCKL